jgi:hypothetical protein
MPPPIPVNQRDLEEDRYPNTWVKVEGEVTAIRPPTVLGVQSLDLRIGGQRFEVTANPRDFDMKGLLVGAFIRVRVILGCASNPQGQRRAALLFLRNVQDLEIIHPGEAKWPDMPLTELSRLLRYHGTGRIGDRIRVRGTMTLLEADDRFAIQHGQTAIGADPSVASNLSVGDCVELIGTLNNRPSVGLWLEDAVGRKCEQASKVVALKADSDQIIQPSAAGLLIEIEGKVVQESNGVRSDILYLVTDDKEAPTLHRRVVPRAGQGWVVPLSPGRHGCLNRRLRRRRDSQRSARCEPARHS